MKIIGGVGEDPDNALMIASGVIDLVSTIAGFCGPFGQAASAVLGIVNTFLDIFGANGPSPMEQMTKLINEQTKEIRGMIEDQTEVLLNALQQLSQQQARLAQNIMDKIDKTTFEDMINEIAGAKLTLEIKKKHLENYDKTCIDDWSEISHESNLQQVIFQMGKVQSLANLFCISNTNLDFCGRLMFLYVTLATARNYVLAETIRVVRQSDFDNQEYKLNGLESELRLMMQSDKDFLAPLINSNSSIEDPYCHVGCAINGAENLLEVENKWKFQDYKVTASSMSESTLID